MSKYGCPLITAPHPRAAFEKWTTNSSRRPQRTLAHHLRTPGAKQTSKWAAWAITPRAGARRTSKWATRISLVGSSKTKPNPRPLLLQRPFHKPRHVLVQFLQRRPVVIHHVAALVIRLPDVLPQPRRQAQVADLIIRREERRR